MSKDRILQLVSISKTFGKYEAVKDVSLTLKKGEIYGLVGENGAGKTSIMRMITGLSHKTSGEIIVKEGIKIGSIIEAPAFYNKLSGFDNLMYFAKVFGISNAREFVADLMRKVGLKADDKKMFSEYSLGMKQRLGLALALMNKPDLLVLDEPINGLDPSGIISVRKLLKAFSDYGVTILISSHILTELSMLATKFGFIHKGRLIQELSRDELRSQLNCHINVDTDNNLAVEEYLSELNREFKVTEEGVKVDGDDSLADKLSDYLFDQNIKVKRLEVIRESLEEYFVRLKGESDNAENIEG